MLTTLKKGYYLGIDGGGTKTHAVIADETGFVLAEGRAGGSNPHNLPIKKALGNIKKAVDIAKEALYKSNSDIVPELLIFEGACLGLAGLDTDDDREIVGNAIHKQIKNKNSCFYAKKLIMVNDGLIGLKSGTDSNWGVCLIAGTGANCYGITQGGKETVAGDWGFILGDQGSAYAMGRAILQQVIKEYDGRENTTPLTKEVLDFLNLKDPSELVTWVYRGSVPVTEIAKISKIVNNPGLMDSLEVSKIINKSISELTSAYSAVIKKLKFEYDSKIPIVLIGGLFSINGRFAQKLTQSILNHTPNAKIIIPTRSPAEGAVKIARLLNHKFDLFPDTALQFVNPIIK